MSINYLLLVFSGFVLRIIPDGKNMKAFWTASHHDYWVSGLGIASYAGAFRGARISTLPTNACSIENNIPLPLFYSRGKWPIDTFEIKCWRAKHDS